MTFLFSRRAVARLMAVAAIASACSPPSSSEVAAPRVTELPTTTEAVAQPNDPTSTLAAETSTTVVADRPCATWFADGEFAISGYSVPLESDDEPSRSMAELAAVGYTHVGPFYDELPNAELAEASAAGLCVIHHVGQPGIDGRSASADTEGWATRAGAIVDEVVADPARNLAVSMWMVLPEELDLNGESERRLLAAITDAIRQADPLDRPVSMFLTSNADEVEFAEAAATLDVITQGQYLVNDGDERRRAILPFRLSRAREFADAEGSTARFVIPTIEHGISDREIAVEDEPLIEAWVRHDVITTIASGADGFLAFSHFPRGRASSFAAYNDAYANTVAAITATGLLSAPTERRELDVAVTNGPESVEVPEILSSGDRTVQQTSTHAVVFERDDTQWIVVVNHTDAAMTVMVDDLEGPYVTIDGVELMPVGAVLTISLAPFEAILARSSR